MDPDRLYPSIYGEDEEAYDIWTKEIGVPGEKITRFYRDENGECDNFWEHGAGMAAHLPGMCAAIFPMPVIGIPMHTTSLGGRDSLYSIVQMPTGIPVATVAINGGANAGILAAKILATSDAALLERLKDYTKNLKESVQKKDARLQEVGYKNY